MGLISEILTEYKADTSDMKAKVKELQGDQKALAQSELESAQARNEHFDQWLEGLAKVGVALAAAKEVADIIWDGYKEGIKEARLQTAAAGIDIDALSKAAGGLQTHMQLLEFAAKANKSAFAVTQEQMETAEKAIHALEQRGVPAAEAIDAVTTAVVTGRTKGLEPYGIVVDKHIKDLQALGEENLTLAQKIEIHKQALDGLRVVAGEAQDSENAIGESMEQAQVKLSDSWANMKKSLGDLAVGMQPLLEALAKAVGLVAQLVKATPSILKSEKGSKVAFSGVGTYALDYLGIGGGDEGPTFNAAGAIEQIKKEATANAAPILEQNERDIMHNAVDSFMAYLQEHDKVLKKMTHVEMKEAIEDAARKFMHAGASLDSDRVGRVGGYDGLPYNAKDAKKFGLEGVDVNQQALADDTLRDASGAVVDYVASVNAHAAAMRGEESSRESRYAAWNKGQANKFLEKTFGPISDFDLYHEAFKALSGAVGSAMGAWIDGSESAGKAFKKFIGDALKGLASQMMIEALKHGAYALGSLAFGDLDGASKHAAAAAAFAAGSIAAAVASKELGGGASGGSASSRSGSAASPSGAPGMGQQHQGGGPIIVIGDAFADDSPRMRQLKAQQLVGAALGTSAGSYS